MPVKATEYIAAKEPPIKMLPSTQEEVVICGRPIVTRKTAEMMIAATNEHKMLGYW